MARPKPGMGRGLSAILSASGESSDTADQELRELPVELIAPNPQQPRRRFDEASLEALAESVRDTGVLQPVLVRPRPGGRYELVAGERRWRAAEAGGAADGAGARARARGQRLAGAGPGREHGA